MRRCAQCARRKREEEFYALIRDEEGRAVRWDSYCIPCRLALQRDEYRTNAERRHRARRRAAEQRARDRERIAEDPSYHEELRARQRVWEAAYRARKAEDDRDPNPGWKWGPMLPAAPLVEVIGDEDVGVSDRSVRRWKEPGARVHLGAADLVLTRLELNWFDVWHPDDFPEAQKVFEIEEEAA